MHAKHLILPILVSCSLPVAACTPDSGTLEVEGDQTRALDSDSFLIFSPSPHQSDHETRYDPQYQGAWDEIVDAYDALNLHAGNVQAYDGEYLDKIHERIGDKPIVLEMQSTAGLNQLGLLQTDPCNAALGVGAARKCGWMAADAYFYNLELYLLAGHGLNVEYIMLDSAFYAPYRHVGYFNSTDTPHSYEAKMKAVNFMDGFIERMRDDNHFGPDLKFIYISHFKLEYVDDMPGFVNKFTNTNCYNTCWQGYQWTNEDEILAFVLDQLPGRFDTVLFDASWSSFSVTPDPWARWDTMIDVAHSRGVRVGNIVHTDAGWGEWCGHHQCWVGPGACDPDKEQEWYLHALSYIHTMVTGGDLIDGHSKLDAMMVGQWHHAPRYTFEATNECEGGRPLAEVMKCAAQATGRPGFSCEQP